MSLPLRKPNIFGERGLMRASTTDQEQEHDEQLAVWSELSHEQRNFHMLCSCMKYWIMSECQGALIITISQEL